MMTFGQHLKRPKETAARCARALASFWRALVWPAPHQTPQPVVLPARLSLPDQWNRVSSVVGEARTSARYISDCQREAAAQIDAATYALQRLREEILPAFMDAPLQQPVRLRPSPAGEFRTPFRRRPQVAA